MTDKNYSDPKLVSVSSNLIYIYVLVLLVLTFVTGFFLGKGAVAGTSTVAQVTPAAQPQAQGQPPAQPQISLATIKGLFSKDVIKFGDGSKKLLLVEVSDPSCPYCHVASGINTDIAAQMGSQFTPVSAGGSYVPPVPEMRKLLDQGKADFVWIYSPGHGNGELATRSLYCANDQGKFWAAHDLLMSAKGYDLLNNQIKTDTSKVDLIVNFLSSAVEKNQLQTCLSSGKYNARPQQDQALAASLGVQGTPGFFVNTTNFAGAYSWTDMKPNADAALK